MELEKTVRLCQLYDTYKNLLTDKTIQILDVYLNYNLGLSEIAEELNMTRQAVFDFVKKAERKLENYERKLGFLKKNTMVKKILCEILETNTIDNGLKVEIEKLLEEV